MAISINVKVIPRASRSEIVGWAAGQLRVRIAAVPTDGRANAALEALLAETLGVRKTAVKVTAGHASPRKRVEIEGLDRAAVERLLRG